MRLFSEKTMETLKENTRLSQSSEHELLLINGGLGCSFGNQLQLNTGTSKPPYNGYANAASIWGCVMTIVAGTFGLSCTLW